MRAIVIGLVAEGWGELYGSGATRMGSWKIVRNEGPSELTWDPPVLSFTIERHGGLVCGSSRAERERWYVDLKERTAQQASAGFKQIHPPAPAFTSKESRARADEVCAAVREGPNSASPLLAREIVAWKSENEVVVKGAALVPSAQYKQTTSGRRKQFRRDLESKLQEIGWKRREEGPTLNFYRS